MKADILGTLRLCAQFAGGRALPYHFRLVGVAKGQAFATDGVTGVVLGCPKTWGPFAIAGDALLQAVPVEPDTQVQFEDDALSWTSGAMRGRLRFVQTDLSAFVFAPPQKGWQPIAQAEWTRWVALHRFAPPAAKNIGFSGLCCQEGVAVAGDSRMVAVAVAKTKWVGFLPGRFLARLEQVGVAPVALATAVVDGRVWARVVLDQIGEVFCWALHPTAVAAASLIAPAKTLLKAVPAQVVLAEKSTPKQVSDALERFTPLEDTMRKVRLSCAKTQLTVDVSSEGGTASLTVPVQGTLVEQMHFMSDLLQLVFALPVQRVGLSAKEACGVFDADDIRVVVMALL